MSSGDHRATCICFGRISAREGSRVDDVEILTQAFFAVSSLRHTDSRRNTADRPSALPTMKEPVTVRERDDLIAISGFRERKPQRSGTSVFPGRQEGERTRKEP